MSIMSSIKKELARIAALPKQPRKTTTLPLVSPASPATSLKAGVQNQPVPQQSNNNNPQPAPQPQPQQQPPVATVVSPASPATSLKARPVAQQSNNNNPQPAPQPQPQQHPPVATVASPASPAVSVNKSIKDRLVGIGIAEEAAAEYEKTFNREQITWDMLAAGKITEDDFKDMKIAIGARRLLLELPTTQAGQSSDSGLTEQPSETGEEAMATRVLDSHRPDSLMVPVIGVMSMPIQPLLNAIEALAGLVPHVEVFAKSANQFAHKYDDKKLDPNLHAALALYTMENAGNHDGSLYVKLNQALRSEDRQMLKPYFPFLRLMMEGLNKCELHKGNVWRGVKKNLSDEYKVGDRFRWWAFSSCTTDLKVLETPMFCGKSGQRTIFNISTTLARNIKPYSVIKRESEVVLPPGIEFEVKSVANLASDQYIIELAQVPNSNVVFS